MLTTKTSMLNRRCPSARTMDVSSAFGIYIVELVSQGTGRKFKGTSTTDLIRRSLVFSSRAVEFEQMSSVICQAAVSSDNISRLKAWWLYRMLFSPASLTEKLTLTWHNHFATSYLKVADVGLMSRQNHLLRRDLRGSFADLLTQMMKVPCCYLVGCRSQSQRAPK